MRKGKGERGREKEERRKENLCKQKTTFHITVFTFHFSILPLSTLGEQSPMRAMSIPFCY